MRGLLDDAAVMEVDGVVALAGEYRVVGGDDEGGVVVVAECEQQGGDLVAGAGVQGAGGFIG